MGTSSQLHDSNGFSQFAPAANDIDNAIADDVDIMASRFSPAAVWLAILLHVCVVRAASSGYFWTYTSRYQYVSSTEYDTYGTRVYSYTYTDETRTIDPTVVPTVAAVSTSTDTYYSTSDLLLVYEWYDASAVASTDLLPETTYDPSAYATSTYTVFYMDVTYTAPSSCSSQFTYTTSTNVYIPSEVRDLMKPTSVVTGTSYITFYLTSGAAPWHTESDYYYTSYVKYCSDPFGGRSSSAPTSGGNSDSNSNSYSYCSYYDNCNVLKIWVIVIAVVIPTIFLLGFLESWFWFRRLMLGKGAMRFGTISWIWISLWVLCFTRFQSKRSQNDQKLLREKWSAMSGGTAFKLWWKWGFRHSYPTELLGEYSRNDSGVPGTTGGAPQMQYAQMGNGGMQPPPPPPFINHNGIIYIPQSQQSPYAPPATSYLNHNGVIYVPQVQGYPPPSASPVSNFSQPPTGYQQPSAYYDATKEVPSNTSYVSAPATEVSTLAPSPQPQHVQPALSEVSSLPSQPGQGGHQTLPAEADGQRVGEHPEWVPPKHN